MKYYTAKKNNALFHLHENRRAHTTYFPFCQVQEQTKLTFGDKSQNTEAEGCIVKEKKHKGISLDDKNITYLDQEDDDIGNNIQIYPTVPLDLYIQLFVNERVAHVYCTVTSHR